MGQLQEIAGMRLECEKALFYFEQISSMPHGSGYTRQISDYLAGFARERGLEHSQDAQGNVIIIKEASAGREDAPAVILQGHIDMVCEREEGCGIDFLRDGLSLYVDGDFIRARGTTLGADDGIAVAYMLAILDDPAAEHPRIEAVFTVDEEIGMLGAEGIDLSMLRGRMLLNMDSDEEGHFLTSCAGGVTVDARIPVEYVRQRGIEVTLTVDGLLGGHSGSEIGKGHANAAVVMARALRRLFLSVPASRKDGWDAPFGICSMSGGQKDNAIPRSCEAVLLVPAECLESLTDVVRAEDEVLRREYFATDPSIRLAASAGEEVIAQVLSPSSVERALLYLRLAPNGVQAKSHLSGGAVETSLNLGILALREDALCVTTSIRSSVASRKEDLRDRLFQLASFIGGEAAARGEYPAWEYRQDSALREMAGDAYRRLFGREPQFESIHAGLECGIFSGKIKGLDCISFGPDIFDIHTTRERLSISSAERVFRFLKELLKSIR